MAETNDSKVLDQNNLKSVLSSNFSSLQKEKDNGVSYSSKLKSQFKYYQPKEETPVAEPKKEKKSFHKMMYEGQEAFSGDGVGSAIGNFAWDALVKPTVGSLIGTARTAANLFRLPKFFKNQDDRQLISKANARINDEWRKLLQSGKLSEEDRMKIRDAIMEQQRNDIPDIVKGTGMDITAEQSIAQTIGAMLTASLVKTGGDLFGGGKLIKALQTMKWKDIAALGIKGSVKVPEVTGGFTTIAHALPKLVAANALEGGVWSVAYQSLDNQFKKNKVKYFTNVAIDSVLFSVPGSAADVGLAKAGSAIFGSGLSKARKGIQEKTFNESRALRQTENAVVPEGFTATETINTTTQKIDDIVEDSTKIPDISKDFHTATPGDIVTYEKSTGQGAVTLNTARITSIEPQPTGHTGEVLEGLIEQQTANRVYRNQVQEELNALKSVRLGNASTEIKNRRLDKIEELQKRLISLDTEDMVFEDSINKVNSILEGKQSQRIAKNLDYEDLFYEATDFEDMGLPIMVRVRDAAGNEELIPLSQLKDSGRIFSRRAYNPVDGYYKNPDLAREAAEAIRKAESNKDNMFYQIRDTKTNQTINVPYNPNKNEAVKLKDALSSQGFKLFDDGFMPDRYPQAVGYFMTPEWGLTKSGVPIKFFRNAMHNYELDLQKYMKRLKGLADQSVVEGKQVGLKRAEINRMLFEAADDIDYDLSKLTPAAQATVLEWREIAEELLLRINQILAGMGRPQIEGKPGYITHILSEMGNLYRQLSVSGQVPEDILSILTRKSRAVMRNSDKNVIDSMLRKRTGGLEYEKNFSNAAIAALKTHLNFIHMQPTALVMDEVINTMKNSGFAASRMPNIKHLEAFRDRLTGRAASPNRAMRDLNNYLKEAMVRERWFATHGEGGIKNPLRNLMSEDVTVKLKEGDAEIRIPKDWVNKAIDVFGPGSWISNLRKVSYYSNLSLSTSFPILNFTQFWAVSVPKLRGSWFERNVDGFKGVVQAVSNLTKKGLNNAMKEMDEKGVMTGMREFWEVEVGQKMKGTILPKSAFWEKYGFNRLMSFTGEFSEYINRAGTMFATKANIKRDAKRGYKYWHEMDEFVKGDLEDWADRQIHNIDQMSEWLGVKLAARTQFRYDKLSRADWQYNPIGAVVDQYNSFFRNWYDVVSSMARKTLNSPKRKTAWKEFWKTGDINVLTEFMNSEDAEFFNFCMQAGGLMLFTSMIGGSLVNEFRIGGGPKAAGGFIQMADGVLTNNEAKFKNGLDTFIKPPAVESFWDLATLTNRQIEDIKNGEFSYKNVGDILKSKPTPTHQTYLSYLAIKSAVTGKPQVVTDPKSGKAIYRLFPDQAAEVFLFGSRAKSSEQRLNFLQKRLDLDAEEQNRKNSISRYANRMVKDLSEMDKKSKENYLAQLRLDGTLDSEMLRALSDAWEAKEILHSDTTTNAISSMDTKSKAQFLKHVQNYMDDDEEFKQWSQWLLVNGAVDAGDFKYMEENIKPSLLDKVKDLFSFEYTKDGEVQNKLGGVGLAHYASTGGTPLRKIAKAAVGSVFSYAQSRMSQVGKKILKLSESDISKKLSYIPEPKPSVKSIKKPTDMFAYMVKDRKLGNPVGDFGETNMPIKLYSHKNSLKVSPSRINAFSDMVYALDRGDFTTANSNARLLDVPWDENRIQQSYAKFKNSDTSVFNGYLGTLGVDTLYMRITDNTGMLFRTPLEGKMLSKENVSKMSAVMRAKKDRIEYKLDLADNGKVVIDNPLAMALATVLKNRGEQVKTYDTFKVLNRWFNKMGNSGWKNHSAYYMADEATATKAELKEFLEMRYSDIYRGDKTLLDRDTDELFDTYIKYSSRADVQDQRFKDAKRNNL